MINYYFRLLFESVYQEILFLKILLNFFCWKILLGAIFSQHWMSVSQNRHKKGKGCNQLSEISIFVPSHNFCCKTLIHSRRINIRRFQLCCNFSLLLFFQIWEHECSRIQDNENASYKNTKKQECENTEEYKTLRLRECSLSSGSCLKARSRGLRFKFRL